MPQPIRRLRGGSRLKTILLPVLGPAGRKDRDVSAHLKRSTVPPVGREHGLRAARTICGARRTRSRSAATARTSGASKARVEIANVYVTDLPSQPRNLITPTAFLGAHVELSKHQRQMLVGWATYP